MLRYRFGTWVLCALAFSCLPLKVHAQTAPVAVQRMDTTHAVNVAGRQRMLAQRMTKAYLMLGQGIDPDGARAILQESVRLFETQLAALKAFQPNAAQAKPLADLDAVWARCKPLLTAQPTKLGADVLYDLSEELQQVAHHVTLVYRDVDSQPQDQLVNLAGRQRMLTQRMMKFYLYETWEINTAPADMELHLARAHFTAVLMQMETSPLTAPKIKTQVAELRRVWEPYQTALFASRDAAKMRRNAPLAAGLSERVLESTEKLVAMLLEKSQAGSAQR
ncbi:type IV pili methyl-accepting chemotaxis transducer N-terminal domain-containing protein [Candidatus Aalborgicola defluviihabitans]|uniref:type IV pili methyl-accepting chemotaxis transducer N-terminal domain-containing protein n=1 Tax=Candidatus Aalborgicola defluviihabitans TaxID=3386187 RepID=UPI001D79ACBD|nr:type IV pili methyl-accepting chemotaxis transducer N-terminal domain-containing protein [Burkholderiales bacterium]MBK6568962.1 type IV pili methyl-accepting chemotaxis transducer N-terminal domain-containing protein [Burkholderiales bacterium]MBK7314413.1 type IV pili methyl-accepting chemotaxis transducer N-terminal domain-containing protein [Burkholderiales bacterium]MBL0245320.1 type IV pili methyl-accepting chemotaxis transducer N-terminal domain-containing protein [Rhodoferax sp.]